MNLFAHNGVDHATAEQAMSHYGMHPVAAALLVTVLVAAFIVLAIYAVKRFTNIEIPFNDKEN